MKQLVFRPLPGKFAVCRLSASSAIPEWASRADFVSITRTSDELSIVCPQSAVPADVRYESGWRCFQLEGPIPFTEVGVLASLLAPLAAAGISVFAISTFDTDYVLVKEVNETAAREAWTASGHRLST